MLIDEVKIQIIAGKGGDGLASFNKTKMSLGPTGGSGGKGGNVYLEGISDLSAFRQFRFKKTFKAEDGKIGSAQLRDGTSGKDLILKVPIGTVITGLKNRQTIEVIKIGQRVLIASGGKGGKGNFHFKSSRNTTPKQFELGELGDNLKINLELKLIADVGFIGLPNVGKSSLLNELTKAKSKVANYAFTTLEPNLGVYYELILADIPGLIEGASLGKGLGIKFLKHIERTKTLFHFISTESIDPILDYKKVRNELDEYNKNLLTKKEYIFLSKKDLIDDLKIEKTINDFKKIEKEIIPISIIDLDSIKKVQKILNNLIKENYENNGLSKNN